MPTKPADQGKTKAQLLTELNELRQRVATVADITQQRQAEESLGESEQKYRRLFSEMSNGCALHEIICDSEGHPIDYITLEVNPAYEIFSGLKRADVLGKKVSEFLPPAELDSWLEIFGPVALTGQSAHYEMYAPFNQKYFAGSAYCPQKGQFAVTFTDITEHHRQEAALRESEARYRSLFQNNLDAVSLSTLDGRILEVNPAACAMYGYTAAEFGQLGRADLVDTTDPRWPLALEERTRTGKFRGELTHLRRDGTPFPVEVSSAVFPDQNGDLKTYVIARDITERKQAEAALQASEARFKAVFDCAGVGVALIDPNGPRLQGNPTLQQMLGYSAEELSEITNLNMTHPDDRALTQARMADLLGGRLDSTRMEKRYQHKNGQTVWVDLSITPIRAEQGQLVTFIGAMVDITARKEAETALQASEARFRTIFQASPIAISISRLSDERFIDVNPAWESISGFSREQIIGRTTPELGWQINPADRERVLKQLREQGGLQGAEVQIRSKSGAVIDALTSVEVIEIGGERCLLRLSQDITERKQMETALRASEEKFRQIIERSGDAIMLTDETGRLVEWNPRMEQITGLARAEAVGRVGWQVRFELLPTEHRTPTMYEQIKANAQTYFQTGQDPQLNQPSHLEIERQDGSYRDLQEMPFSIQSKAGFWRGNIIRDVTEQKQTERIEAAQLAVSRILAESPEPEAALRQILESIAIRLEWDLAKLWWPKSDGSRLVWRDGWRRPNQPGLAEFDQLSRGLIFAPDEGLPGAVWQTSRAVWDQGLRLTKLATAAQAMGLHAAIGIPIIKDGVTTGVMTFFSRSARPLEERLLTTLTDLGRQIGQFLARQEVEERLRRHEQMISTSPDWMSLLDRDYVYQTVNQTYLTLNNKANDQIVGHSVAELLGEAVFSAVVKPYLDQALAGETVQYQEWFDFPAVERRFNDVTYVPYREKDGTVTGVVVSGRDITEAKLLEERLQQAEKMGVIGQLAAGMAHHYNNMLTSIIGFTSLTLHRLPPDDPQTKNLTQVLQTAERMAVLVRQLLAFAQKQLLQFKTAPLNELVRQLQDRLQQMVPASIEFDLHLAPEEGQVRVDPRQFEYLLLALVSNAVDAMPRGGRLTLTTANVSLGAVEAGWYDLTPGDYVLLTVKDTGIGLSDEVKAHLFEPFFTTKEVGQGTGLGLAMSLGIAKQHSGHLLAESQPGQGATFMLYLPCLAPPPPPLPPVRPAAAGTILLVEADPMVREFVAEILSDEGYTVLKAANDEVASQLMAGRPDVSLQLLLTSAHANSPALIEQLKPNSPDLKVIFLIDEVADLSFELKGIQADFLVKPFAPSGLVQKVRVVLEVASE